jgi:hypothetical protein
MLRRGAEKTMPIMMKVYGTIASLHVVRVVLVADCANNGKQVGLELDLSGMEVSLKK